MAPLTGAGKRETAAIGPRRLRGQEERQRDRSGETEAEIVVMMVPS